MSESAILRALLRAGPLPHAALKRRLDGLDFDASLASARRSGLVESSGTGRNRRHGLTAKGAEVARRITEARGAYVDIAEIGADGF